LKFELKLQLGGSGFVVRDAGDRSSRLGEIAWLIAWLIVALLEDFKLRTPRVAGNLKFEVGAAGDSNFEVRGYLKIVARLEIEVCGAAFLARGSPYAAEDSRSQDSPVGMSGPSALR
jgi:hypothetical protein